MQLEVFDEVRLSPNYTRAYEGCQNQVGGKKKQVEKSLDISFGSALEACRTQANNLSHARAGLWLRLNLIFLGQFASNLLDMLITARLKV